MPTTNASILNSFDDVGLFQGSLAPGSVTNDTTLALSGSYSAALLAGESLRIFDGTTLLGTATLNTTARTWSFTTAALKEGSHSFTARVADAAGNLGPAGTAFAITVDTKLQPGVLSLTEFVDTGDPTDFVSSDNSFNLSLTGQEAGATLTYQRSSDGGTSWSSTTAAQTSLANGSYLFRVRVQDAAGNVGSSNVLGVQVANGNSPPSGTVGITGRPTVGATLIASHTLSNPDGIPASGSGAITYQWNRDGIAIGGATSNQYTATTADLARKLTVTASYTDNLGTAESVTSAPTEAIAPSTALFAPYIDMGLWPVPDLNGLAVQNGIGLFTLGFLQASSNSKAAWGGYSALELESTDPQAVAIKKEISDLRALGGDVIVSFGGASGTSLAVDFANKGRSAVDLAAAYTGVVDSLGAKRLDFDLEGTALTNNAANTLLSSALALLQGSRPTVQISYTLEVLPQGLTAASLAAVSKALDAGVRLDTINIMAMDYGDGAAPPAAKSMGAYAIDAATATRSQLSSLYSSRGKTFDGKQLGVTPMIGVNDVTSEVFRPSDAQQLEDFARSTGVGMLSMWSASRDNPGSLGQVTDSTSGLSDPAGTFSRIFNNYGRDPLTGLGTAGTGSSGGSTGGSPGGSTGGTSGGSGTPLTSRTLVVDSTTTSLQADAAVAERFQLSYAWGRTLTINGFTPGPDQLDLLGFWGEGSQAKVLPSATGSIVDLPFNQQQILLPGVAPALLTPQVLLLWQG